MNLFLDIETGPDPAPGALDYYREQVKPPGSYKKADSIAAWLAENADNEAERLWLKTALQGAAGEILCIGWAWQDEPVNIISRRHEPQEGELLTAWYELLGLTLQERRYSDDALCVIGHNIGFDLRFLFQRTVIHGVSPLVKLPVEYRPGSERTFCTMQHWAGFREYVTLKDLAICLGLNSTHKEQVNTDRLFELWRADPGAVESYCAADVDLTREVYRRLRFQAPRRPSVAPRPERELEELPF